MRKANAVKKEHPYLYLVEGLMEDSSYMERPMFGCLGCYVRGELALVLAATGKEPWNGVLLATSREHHESLLADFEPFRPHPVLGKWLYLSEEDESFEREVEGVVRRILEGDPRIGVVGRGKPLGGGGRGGGRPRRERRTARRGVKGAGNG